MPNHFIDSRKVKFPIIGEWTVKPVGLEKAYLRLVWGDFKTIARFVRQKISRLGYYPKAIPFKGKSGLNRYSRMPQTGDIVKTDTPLLRVVESKRSHNLSFIVPEQKKPAKEIGRVLTIAEMMEIANSL